MHNQTSYFLFHITSFKKFFYVSLGNNFFTVFVEARALGNCPVCPPLNPAHGCVLFDGRRLAPRLNESFMPELPGEESAKHNCTVVIFADGREIIDCSNAEAKNARPSTACYARHVAYWCAICYRPTPLASDFNFPDYHKTVLSLIPRLSTTRRTRSRGSGVCSYRSLAGKRRRQLSIDICACALQAATSCRMMSIDVTYRRTDGHLTVRLQ